MFFSQLLSDELTCQHSHKGTRFTLPTWTFDKVIISGKYSVRWRLNQILQKVDNLPRKRWYKCWIFSIRAKFLSPRIQDNSFIVHKSYHSLTAYNYSTQNTHLSTSFMTAGLSRELCSLPPKETIHRCDQSQCRRNTDVQKYPPVRCLWLTRIGRVSTYTELADIHPEYALRWVKSCGTILLQKGWGVRKWLPSRRGIPYYYLTLLSVLPSQKWCYWGSMISW